MPKYFCDYCDTHLTHDSPSVRKTHCSGRKHKDNVRAYYQTWMEEQAQQLIDKTTQAFQQGKMMNNPFGMNAVPPMMRPMGAPMMAGPPMMQMRPMGPPMMGAPVMMMGGPRPGM